jgi:hypothetical protein
MNFWVALGLVVAIAYNLALAVYATRIKDKTAFWVGLVFAGLFSILLYYGHIHQWGVK